MSRLPITGGAKPGDQFRAYSLGLATESKANPETVPICSQQQSLKFRQAEHRLQIELPPQLPDPTVTVVTVRTLYSARSRSCGHARP
jgi:hypothetical protein